METTATTTAAQDLLSHIIDIAMTFSDEGFAWVENAISELDDEDDMAGLNAILAEITRD